MHLYINIVLFAPDIIRMFFIIYSPVQNIVVKAFKIPECEKEASRIKLQYEF